MGETFTHSSTGLKNINKSINLTINLYHLFLILSLSYTASDFFLNLPLTTQHSIQLSACSKGPTIIFNCGQ